MKYALMYEDTVVEVYTPPSGVTISDCLPADRVQEYISVPDHVVPGYTLHPDGTWKAPSPQPVEVD